ncbi:MAG: DUF222 domain-containing protein [Actinomycetota bacterium]
MSETQAKEIASAAAASPSSEPELLGIAETEGVQTLRQRCAEVRAAATPDELARYDRIHRSRSLRHWSDGEGAFCLQGRFTPDAGAVLLAALEPYKEKVFAEARKDGRKESYEAYAADALVEMACHVRGCKQQPSSATRGPGALVRVLVDHKALERGEVNPGETCVIEGIGPIPVATAKALASDAVMAALSTDGTEINKVTHCGRQVTARQRTALEVRDKKCVVPGCEARHHLQIDHVVEWNDTRHTKLSELARLCSHHHYLKTYKGWVLSGGPEAWRFDPLDVARAAVRERNRRILR